MWSRLKLLNSCLRDFVSLWGLGTLLAFGGALVIEGCGFHPVYGDQTLSGGNNPMRGNIAINPIPGHEGQLLKADLEDRFNPEGLNTKGAPYQLTVILRKSLIPSVVKSDGTIQRYELRLDTDFNLYKAGTPAPVFTGKLHHYGSYNVAVNANFATYEAEQDVIERTLQELAEDYVLRISGYLAAKPAP